MAHSQEESLTAVVLHALLTVEVKTTPVTLERLVLDCERDPTASADRDAVEVALRSLIDDGLAERVGALFKPTRAAIRSHELSF